MSTRFFQKTFLTALVTFIFSMAWSMPAMSEDAPENDWQFNALIYGWMPYMDGTTSTGGDVDIDFDTIIENLDMTFMGAFEAKKGKWSLFIDPVYMKLSGGDGWTENIPVGAVITVPVNVDASIMLKSWIADFGVSYNVLKMDKFTLDILAGARYTSMDAILKLNITGLITTHSGRIGVSEHNWDGIAGVKGIVDINEKWFIPYHFDIGTGDSDLTLNAVGAVGYRFKWGQVLAGYRYLHYNFDKDNIGVLMKDLDVGGPIIGAQFNF